MTTKCASYLLASIVIAFSTLLVISAAHAQDAVGLCEDAWNATSAAKTCTLTVTPIPIIYATSGNQPDITCELHVQCLSGGTHPEDPNSFNTREINNTKDSVAPVYRPYMKSLRNCNGNLQVSPCR